MPSHPAFDPRVILAMNMVTQQGVYALLIGSGVSTAASIPTGWGVVEQLVRRVAAAQNSTIAEDGWQQWWLENHPDVELGYSGLLELLGPRPASRTALLTEFFEATEEERADGHKTPTGAHHAIAGLVAKGTVRVIITTNFDRLIEHALDAANVSYQVISTEAAVSGMEPLAHAQATVIKLHGDYMSLDQRNTVSELSAYSPATAELLDRVLDEYGLVIAGWSGDWDHALVGALEARANRRYPLVWTAWREAGAVARRLTSGRGDVLVEHAAADDFFPDLLVRVEAIETMADTPPSLDMKIARLRRALPDPVRHLEVRALFERELQDLRTWTSGRPRVTDVTDPAEARAEVTAIRTRFDSLLQLFAQGILLDRDRQHDDLWVWVLQQALDARAGNALGAVTPWWDSLAHFPAYLLLRVGILAALAARHEEVSVRLCCDPRWSSIVVLQGAEMPAHEALHMHRVLDKNVWLSILEATDGARYYWPGSRVSRAELTPMARTLFGEAGAARALDRMEYRLALASTILRPGDPNYYHQAAAGDYLIPDRYTLERDPQLELTADFLANGDLHAWQDAATPSVSDLAVVVESLDDRLRAILNSVH